MKELQTANENKQKELETVRKVGVQAAGLHALGSVCVVEMGFSKYIWHLFPVQVFRHTKQAPAEELSLYQLEPLSK